MKTNKWGMTISLLLTIMSVLGAILFQKWWQNFSFAILGSSILSFAICMVNYFVLRKELVNRIVIDTYKINNFGYAELFSTTKDLSLESAVKILNVLDDRYYSVYIEINELFTGLFWIDCRRKKVKAIKELIDNALIKIYRMESFIEVFTQEALNKTKKLYQDLDEFIDDNNLYLKTLKLAKSFFSNISSLEEVIDKNKLKKECAKEYEKTLK